MAWTRLGLKGARCNRGQKALKEAVGCCWRVARVSRTLHLSPNSIKASQRSPSRREHLLRGIRQQQVQSGPEMIDYILKELSRLVLSLVMSPAARSAQLFTSRASCPRPPFRGDPREAGKSCNSCSHEREKPYLLGGRWTLKQKRDSSQGLAPATKVGRV